MPDYADDIFVTEPCWLDFRGPRSGARRPGAVRILAQVSIREEEPNGLQDCPSVSPRAAGRVIMRQSGRRQPAQRAVIALIHDVLEAAWFDPDRVVTAGLLILCAWPALASGEAAPPAVPAPGAAIPGPGAAPA